MFLNQLTTSSEILFFFLFGDKQGWFRLLTKLIKVLCDALEKNKKKLGKLKEKKKILTIGDKLDMLR